MLHKSNRATEHRIRTDDSYPVVNVGTRDQPVYLPAKVCKVLPGQSCRKKLDSNQTTKMKEFAVRKAAENAATITREGCPMMGLDSSSNPVLVLLIPLHLLYLANVLEQNRLGINVTPKLITVSGRCLDRVSVSYRGERTPTMTENASWDLRSMKVFSEGKLPNSLAYVELEVRGLINDMMKAKQRVEFLTLRDAFDQFVQTSTRSGLRIPNVKTCESLALDGVNDGKLEQLFKQYSAKKVGFIFIVIPTKSIPLYSRIKHLGDVKYGIHTVCVIGAKFRKKSGKPTFDANVALKANTKLGGTNHVASGEKLSFIREGKTMVVGIDVTHPSPGSSTEAPSIAAMVASINKDLAQWPAVLRIQERRKEMVTDLGNMIKSRLSMWMNKGGNSALPDNILIYRDGVSEGQYAIVLDEELPLIREGCKVLYSAKQQKEGLPRITIVVVGKRHNTRFYPIRKEDADEYSNPKAGTVVDRGITEAQNWDFFLQSHTAIIGTARPAHYFVVHDEIFRRDQVLKRYNFDKASDMLENLTNTMCYLSTRSMLPISYCPAAFYADKVCERARQYINEVYDETSSEGSTAGGARSQLWMEQRMRVHDKLKDTMFYM